jgi:stage IV sporulation protein FB
MSGCSVQRWSISLGRWWGIAVYLHVFFVLSALLALAVTLPSKGLAGPGLLMVAVLLVSVTLHEVGHALAAIRVGGKVDAIVLGPVGGLMSPRVPDEPEIHLFVALAGPIMHLLLAVLAAIVLAATAGDAPLLGLLNPFVTPENLVEPGTTLVIAAKLTLWLNWILMLLNLLPAYPFDGGPVLRAMLWPALGRRTARVVTARIAMGVASLFCLASVLAVAGHWQSQIPNWIPLLMLGLFLLFSARQDLAAAAAPEWSDEPAGYQLSSDGLDLLDVAWANEDEEDGVLVEHQQRPAEQSRREQEAVEDARVDSILARLHDSNWESLSPEEIAILQRASRRYRRRHHLADD